MMAFDSRTWIDPNIDIGMSHAEIPVCSLICSKQLAIKIAVEEGSLAFWATIANAFPQVMTGNFPPDADFELDKAMTKAIEIWLESN